MHNSNGKKYKSWYGENNKSLQAIAQTDATNVIYARDAEPALLTSILLQGKDTFLEASSYLKADDFYSYRNMLIYGTMEMMHEKGLPIDSITLTGELRALGLLDKVSEDYIQQLKNMDYGLATEGYIQQIHEASLIRALLVNGDKLHAMALNPKISFEDKVAETLSSIHALIAKSGSRNGKMSLSDLLPDYNQRLKERNNNPALSPYIKTGLTWVDNCIGGLCKDKFYVFGGEPKMGKSSLLMLLAYNALRQNKRVLFISLEMTVERLIDRMVSMVSAIRAKECREPKMFITGRALQFGTMKDEQLPYFDTITRELASMQTAGQFVIEEMRVPTLETLNNRVIRASLDTGFDLVVIDYLGGDNIAPSLGHKNGEAGHISEMVLWADRIAKAYHVPVVSGAQINRAGQPKGTRTRLPQKTDIKGSSTWEEKAQVVALLYREHVHNPKTADPHYAQLVIAAHRDGGQEIIPLHWQGEYTLLSDWKQANHIPQEINMEGF